MLFTIYKLQNYCYVFTASQLLLLNHVSKYYLN